MTSTEHLTPDTAEDAPERAIQLAGFTVTVDESTAYDVTVRTADYVAYDRAAAKHGWGSSQSSPFLFSAFLAYSAARRAGHVPAGQSFDAFCESVEDVTPYRGATARPTRRAASPA